MSKLWIYLILFLYVSVTAYLGWLGFKRTKNDKDYLIAGGDMHPFLLAMSYGATFISTSAIVGFGGAASLFGMGVLWLTFLNIFVGIFIAFVVFGKRTLKMGRKLGAQTFPEFLGERYQSKFIQGFSGLIIFLGMPLYAAAVMIGAARFIESALGIPYIAAVLIFSFIIAAYVMSGGLKGVFYTDAFQGSIMFIGMAILIFAIYIKLGGISAAHQALTDLASHADMFAAAGHQGWTQMPVAGSNFWYTLVTSIILGVGIGVLAQPQLIVRFLTVKGPRELNRAVLIGGVFILFMTGVAFVVGSLTNVYFMETKGVISFLAADKNIDRVIPIYIREVMPVWFSYIFTLTLISAAMSTLSSVFHTMGTSISRDVYQKAITGDKPKFNTLTINRVGVVITLLITVWLAFTLPGGIVAAATALFFSIASAAFLPAYCLGLFWARATKVGAISSMVGGLLFALFWMVFVQASNAGRIGLSQYLTGAVSIASPPWAWMEAIVVALPFSLIVMIIVSLATQPFSQEHLEKAYGKGVELN
jgi:SSS family solute:Na+ symporter